MKIWERTTCRISGGPLIDILDLGQLPLSCFPLPNDPNPPKHPVCLSLNPESGLVQLKHTIDPNAIYSHYWYMSGINQSMPTSLKSIVDQALARTRHSLAKNDIVVDIASNDGTLLSNYPDSLFRVGIDPAKNIKPKAANLHINTYFSAAAYRQELGEKKAKIITSIAVFYDLENPIQFAKDIAEILNPEGLWIMEMSYLSTMLAKNAFETICAEHLEYYSLSAIDYILKQAKLKVEDMELNDVNGGSFRLYIRHEKIAKERPFVQEMRNVEKTLQLHHPDAYKTFAKNIEKNKTEMLYFLEKQKSLGKKVIGYGASTKGNTTLAYYGIGPDLLPFVAERNPMKWGRETVTRIPIIAEEEMRKMKPDYLLAFPYHFMEEFLQREKDLILEGTKFISPVPELTFFPL